MFELIFGTERPRTAACWMAVAAFTCYCVCKCLYNIYFHPLSKIPGPKLAVMGSLYEFYYDVVKDGTYLWEIEKMHRKYGKSQITTIPAYPRQGLTAFPKVQLFVSTQKSCMFRIHSTTQAFIPQAVEE